MSEIQTVVRVEEDNKWVYLSLLDSKENTLSTLSIEFEMDIEDMPNYVQDYAMIYNFFSEIRGRGYGTRLMKEAEKIMKKFSVPMAKLSVMYNNEKAIRLYKKLGYVLSEDNNSYFTYTKIL